MPPVIERVGPAFAYSMFRYLTTATYTVGITTGKLTDHHVGLEIRAGYPDDLSRITVPRLALVTPTLIAESAVFFGAQIREDRLPFEIYGFIAGLGAAANQADAANRLYRDKSFSDVYQLLAGEASDAGFMLYDVESPHAELGVIELYDVRGRLLLQANSDLDADRYRFIVEGAAHLS